eukprot:9503106-Pyramimonas_sp.AAC.1
MQQPNAPDASGLSSARALQISYSPSGQADAADNFVTTSTVAPKQPELSAENRQHLSEYLEQYE